MRTRDELIRSLERDRIAHTVARAGDGWMVVTPSLGARILGTGIGEGTGFGYAAFETPPIPVKIVMPPARSGGRKMSKVSLMILVDEAGRVTQDKIFESSGFALPDSLATDAVRQSRFIPARRMGKAILAWTRYEVRFENR